MLWAALHLSHLAIEARQSCDFPLAITEGRGARRRLIDCNLSARKAQLTAGMDVPAALLRVPTLQLVERSPSEEKRVLHALACWAHQFTSDIHVDVAHWMVFLELGASVRYFEGLVNLQRSVHDGLAHLGYTAAIGIAPTREAAALLTSLPQAPPVLTISLLRPAIASLALERLSLDSKTIEQLHAVGLATVEDLLGIPASALARRFGPTLPRYLRRLLGEESHPHVRHRLPSSYKRRCSFLEPVETLEGLLFPLRRVLQELEGYLRARDVAIQHFAVTLRHRDAPELLLELTTSRPQRDATQLFALLREKLERTRFTAAATELLIAANEFVAPQVIQRDLFDDRGCQHESWSALLDKLRARLGDDAIRYLSLRDDHRPERAWCVSTEASEQPLDAAFPDRPLWLLTPTPITQLPQLLGTPERIEAGWWQGDDSIRDYYLARSAEGARWWLYRDRFSGCWYLQGLWA